MANDVESVDALAATHQVVCRGNGLNGEPVLRDGEDVIVLAYRSGAVRPLCRYYFKAVASRCNWEHKPGDASEDDMGVCIYSRR